MNVDKNSVRGLLIAAETGDLRKLENYLKYIPVNAVNEQSETALHFAAANGQQNAVRILATKGAALDCFNWCDWTPLMYAAYYGHTDVVSYLVENKAQINVCNSRLVTPLICAARNGHKAVIEILLENGAEADPKRFVVPPTNQEIKAFNNQLNTAIDTAERAQKLLERRPPLTALMAAAQHGHLGIVSLLMQYKTPIDYQNDVTGYTALMLAAINGHIKIVELLIETGGADANLTNYGNQTAYSLSFIRKRTDVEAYLNSRTMKRVTEIPHQYSPLILAAKSGKVQEVERIFRTMTNVDVNVVSDEGVTPLIYASLNNHIEVVKLLLRKGAKTDIQDKDHGWTALMHATIKRNVEVVKLLLKSGADVNIKNNNNLSVFDLATLAGLPQITRLLAPGALGTQGKSSSMERDLKNGKGILSKVGSRMRRGRQLNRVPVHDIGLNTVDDTDTTTHNTELRKTSSIITVLDASKQANGSVRPKLSLAAPQVNLPDDVVAPVLPPYPTLKSFDIPKLPMMGVPGSLNNSGGSYSGDNFNNSNDSSSFRNYDKLSTTSGLKRPKMPINVLPYHAEPDSPQSSLTASEFTSVSNYRGTGAMPNSGFNSPSNRPSLNFSKPNVPQWYQQPISPVQQAFTPSFQSPPPSQYRPGVRSPNSINDLSIRSVSSDVNDGEDDINLLLQKLNMESYRSQFAKEEVDMDVLREMDDDDLKDLGVDETIYRRRILEAVTPKNNKVRPVQNLPMNVRYSPTPPGKPPSLISSGFSMPQTALYSNGQQRNRGGLT